MRLMALDAFTLDVYDSPANDKAFGRPGSGRGRSAFPQVRVLWDKNFFKFDHIRQVLARGANLLAMVKKGLVLLPIQRMGDGSYLAKSYRNTYARDHDLLGIIVRVIEYTFDDPARKGHGEKHRLITTLLDPVAHPATTLIELYHVRWEEELAIDELKTHQMIKPLLKSQTSAGVIQEIMGLLLGHFVLRTLMFEAAATKSVSPLRISFIGALNILEVRMPLYPKTPLAQQKWRADVIREISGEILPPRTNGINPRVIKRKMSKWKKKRPEHLHHPQPT